MFWDGDPWVDDRPLDRQGALAPPRPRRRALLATIAMFVSALTLLIGPDIVGSTSASVAVAVPGASLTVAGDATETATADPTQTATPDPTQTTTPAPRPVPTRTPTAPVPLNPTRAPTSTPVAAPGPSVVELTSSVTAAQFVSAVQDNSTDVIELAGGVYRPGVIRLNVDRTRRLLIRPTAGATVVFAGGSEPAFDIGLGGVAGGITIQGLVFDGFRMRTNGIIWLGNCHDITVNSMVVRNSTGQPGYSWALYVSTDGGAGPRNVVANNWIVDGGARTLGGLGIGHTPAAQGVTANGWHVSNAGYAIYSSTTATGVHIDSWTINSSGITTFANLSVVLANPAGTIKNVHATNSGAAEIFPPMVDGGGNTWN